MVLGRVMKYPLKGLAPQLYLGALAKSVYCVKYFHTRGERSFT